MLNWAVETVLYLAYWKVERTVVSLVLLMAEKKVDKLVDKMVGAMDVKLVA